MKVNIPNTRGRITCKDGQEFANSGVGNGYTVLVIEKKVSETKHEGRRWVQMGDSISVTNHRGVKCDERRETIDTFNNAPPLPTSQPSRQEQLSITPPMSGEMTSVVTTNMTREDVQNRKINKG